VTQTNLFGCLLISTPSNYRTIFKARMPSIKDLADAIDQLEEDQDGEPTAMG
jgi:hypothetical protein